MEGDTSATESGSKVHRTAPHAQVIDAVSEGVSRAARLSPQQLLGLFAVFALLFVCSTQAFQMWAERGERQELSRERAEAAAAAIREHNAQSELTRLHCATEAKELRAFFADQNEKRMRFESEERAKDRATLSSLTLKLAELERAISAKRSGEE